MLKSWLLVLKITNTFFTLYMASFCDMFQNLQICWNTTFKQEKRRLGLYWKLFLFFCKVMSFTAAEKLVRFISLKTELPVCQILHNFTKGNARKFTVSFAFCFTHVDVIKYLKTLSKLFPFSVCRLLV